MAVLNIKKAFIIGHQQVKTDLLSGLQREELLEITEVGEGPEGEEWSDLITADTVSDEVTEIEDRMSRLHYAINFLSRFEEVKKSIVEQFAGSKVYMPENEFERHIEDRDECFQLCDMCRELDEKLSNINNRIAQLETDIEELTPWQGLDVSLDEVNTTRNLAFFLGEIDAASWNSFREELEDEIPFFHEKVNEGDHVHFLLIYYQPDQPLFSEVGRKFDITEVDLSSYAGRPGEEIEMMESEIEALKEERAELESEAQGLVPEKKQLLALHDALQIEREQLQVVENLGRTERTFILEGWVRERDEDELKSLLKTVSDDLIYDSREPDEDEVPPVAISNPQPVWPFEVVTQLYGTPGQRDVDPTAVMAPFFFVFFGLCLTDAGYGLVLSLLSWVAMKKIRMAGMAKKLFQLLFVGGIATFILGALTGGWFGDLLPLGYVWFDPVENPMYFLLLSFVLGVIQIYAGLAMQFYMNIKEGYYLDGIFDQGFWFAFLTGLIFKFVLPVALESSFIEMLGTVLTYGGLIGLVLTQGRHQKNIVAKIGSGILSLYDTVQYVSDVLSYSRLLALGLATSVIAIVINSIATLLTGIPFIGYILTAVVLVVGHLFNLVINLLSSYVHTSRLQYVEFFSKFFTAGGDAFEPFGIRTEYIDLELTERMLSQKTPSTGQTIRG